jgi:hypothetical protein
MKNVKNMKNNSAAESSSRSINVSPVHMSVTNGGVDGQVAGAGVVTEAVRSGGVAVEHSVLSRPSSSKRAQQLYQVCCELLANFLHGCCGMMCLCMSAGTLVEFITHQPYARFASCQVLRDADNLPSPTNDQPKLF